MVKFMPIPETPRGTNRSNKIDADVEELKKRPGETALLLANWKSGSHSGYKSRGVKTACRRNMDGTWNIFGWWPTPQELKQDEAAKAKRVQKRMEADELQAQRVSRRRKAR